MDLHMNLYLGQFEYFTNLHCWASLEELLTIIPLSSQWSRYNLPRYVVASGRTRRLVISCVFCVKWVRWGVGGGGVGGMLTFIGLAPLRDATLLHVLFNLHNYVMLRYCTFSSIYTTTWCYATARSLQFTQLRDGALLHVLFNLHTYVMLRYCTFSSMYTTTWCYVDWGGWVGGGDVNVHWTCTLTWCYATARSLQFTQLRDATLTGVGGLGGWVGMLTFIGLAHLRDATLLTFSSLHDATLTSSSLALAHSRHATLLSVGAVGGCVSKFFIWLKDIYPRCSFLCASNAQFNTYVSLEHRFSTGVWGKYVHHALRKYLYWGILCFFLAQVPSSARGRSVSTLGSIEVRYGENVFF